MDFLYGKEAENMLVGSFECMTCLINKHFVQLYRNTFEYVNEGCLEPSLSCFLDVMHGLLQ